MHEVVSGEKLLTPAFRRKVSEYVEETGKMTSDEGHRPARLYKEIERTEKIYGEKQEQD